VEPFVNLPPFQQLGFIAGCAERGLRELSRFRKLVRIDDSALRPAASFLWQCVGRVGQLGANDPIFADHFHHVCLVFEQTEPDRDSSSLHKVLRSAAGIIMRGFDLLRDPSRGGACAAMAGIDLLMLIETIYNDPTEAEALEWNWQETFIVQLASKRADQIGLQLLDELTIPDYGEPEQFAFPLSPPE
jgi:hypothetical protein